MGTFLSIIPIVFRRVSANKRLLLAVVIGAVLASALMSTTSIYTDTIRDLGLRYAIRTNGALKNDILIHQNSQSSVEDTYNSNQEFIATTAKQTIGPLAKAAPTNYGRSATFYPTAPGGAVSEAESRPRSHMQFINGLEAHVNVVDGRMPRDAAPYDGSTAPSIEVAIGKAVASTANVKVGDRFDLHPFWIETAQPIRATVVGIIEQKDPTDLFWMGQTDFFVFPSSNWQTLPFFITQPTFFRTIAAYLPSMVSDYMSYLPMNTGPINPRNADSARASLDSFKKVVESNLQRVQADSSLSTVLSTYGQKLFFTRIPLLVLVLQIAGIVLYYLFMVSTMVVERQTGEIALLKSRGATTLQVMQIYVIEGFVVAVLALVIGPPLAAGVIALLGHTPPFADLSGGHNLPVRLTGDAYLWASAGAVLAYATLLLPAFQATRRTVVQQRTLSARPSKAPVFTRYYLDVVMVGVGGILFYQLDRKGSLVNHKLFGEQTTDPLLLLTPAFFILTIGIVFLRLFPLVLRALAWLVARMQGTAVLIGMWQLVRNPVHYSRLVLLLMLATAVGMFSASFGATLDRSYADRAGYVAGSDLTLSGVRKSDASGPATFGGTMQSELGAEAASPVVRLSGSQGQVVSRTEVAMLGVDPKSFASVARFRGDYASDSLHTILETLDKDGPAGNGLEVPRGSRWLGLWVNPTDLKGRIGLDIQVRDATGRYLYFNLGPNDGLEMQQGWSFMAADLSRPNNANGAVAVSYPQAPPQEPLVVTSIAVRFLTRVSALTGSMQLDDLQASSDASVASRFGVDRIVYDPTRSSQPMPGSQVIADFDSIEKWTPIQGQTPAPMQDEERNVASGSAGSALDLRWRPVQGQPQTHGLHPKADGDDKPLQAFASEGFLKETNAKVGDTTRMFVGGSFIDVQVVGSFGLFPTLGDTRNEAGMVVNGARLMEILNANPRTTGTVPDELWMKPGDGTKAAVQKAIADGKLQATVVSFAELRKAQQKDPLVAAGWQGILFISFAAILILSAIGFLIYSYLTAQKRTLEFAVLRTMGFSRRQIATVVGFEQAFVIGLGMIAGTGMGLRLGGLMIRYMGVTETGSQVLPPMLLHVSWITVLTAWLTLAFVFALTIGVVILLYSRLALHRVLRIGEL